jgi:fucose permease
LLIIPSANANSFPAILASLFVVALGFSLQQTSAQPFAIALGDPSTGSHWLNLAGGINSFGTTLGPIIINILAFHFFLTDRKGLLDPMLIGIVIMTLFLLWTERKAFRGLLK